MFTGRLSSPSVSLTYSTQPHRADGGAGRHRALEPSGDDGARGRCGKIACERPVGPQKELVPLLRLNEAFARRAAIAVTRPTNRTQQTQPLKK